MLIYKVTNKINGYIYIGQTSLTLEQRKWRHEHESINVRRKTVKFHNALSKYGFDNFVWEIIKYLREHDIAYINYGCDEKNNVDYIDYAKRLSYAVVNGSVDLGILICGTGIGMSIVANKVKNILELLGKEYGEAKCTLEYKTPLQLLIATYLIYIMLLI